LKHLGAKSEIENILKALGGYEIISVESIAELLEEIKQKNIKVTFTEIQMKNPDPSKIVQEVRKIKTEAELAMVMVDTEPSNENYRFARDRGALYILYPSDKALIVQTIMRAVASASLAVIFQEKAELAVKRPTEEQKKAPAVRDITVGGRSATSGKLLRDAIIETERARKRGRR